MAQGQNYTIIMKDKVMKIHFCQQPMQDGKTSQYSIQRALLVMPLIQVQDDEIKPFKM